MKEEDAIKIIKRMIAEGVVSQEAAEKYFPELKESEDERIRKGLIRSFKSLNTLKTWNGLDRMKVISWLEKQGNLIAELQKAYFEIDRLEQSEQKLTYDKLVEFKDKLYELFQRFRYKGILTNGDILEYVDEHVQELLVIVNNQKSVEPIIDFKASDWYVSKVDGKIHKV